MSEQNYGNHKRMVFGYHGVLSAILLLSTIGSVVNLVKSIGVEHRLYSAALIVTLHIAVLIIFWYARVFPLKAQDRAIRAEEGLRHMVLTGKPLDSRLRIGQVIALRFASDAEFPALAERAVKEGLSSQTIKTSIKDWRADEYRV